MMRRAVLISAALPLLATAQLQLFTFDGTNEKAVSAITDIGDVPSGDTREIRFRARNSGSSAILLQSVSISGQGFTISSAPSLPFTIAPTNFTEIRVRFSPTGVGSYSATLSANSLQTLLRATVSPSATVTLADGTVLASGGSIDFGRVQKGQTVSRTVKIANGSNASLPLQSCSVSGDVYHATGLACPMTLAPSAAVSVTLSFDPKSAGTQQGTLKLDARTFSLTGVAFDPPLPDPSISFDAGLKSGTQQKLVIKLSSVSQATGAGTVTLSFQPTNSSIADDPAIRFTGPGSRNLSFQVKEGDQTATFPTGVDTVFQTGTTAGTIVFRVTLGTFDRQFTFPVAATVISVDRATATRRVNDLDISVTGFDNTRTAGSFAFTFFDKNGQAIQPGSIRTDWSSTFSTYFRSSSAGGSFTMRATFPVTGDATQIGGVEVEMANSAGTTKTARISF